MKHRMLFLVALILISGSVMAQEKIQWHTLTEAIELNKKEPRKFIVDVYTDWCGWCKRMDAMTFSNEQIAKYINENFYAVKFNAEQKDDIVLGNRTYKYIDNGGRGFHEVAYILTRGQLSYPTVVFLDEKLNQLTVSPGYKTPKQLEVLLVYFNEADYAKIDFEDFQAQFQGKLFVTK